MESSEKNMFGLLLTLYIFIPVKYQCETDKNVSVLKKKTNSYWSQTEISPLDL